MRSPILSSFIVRTWNVICFSLLMKWRCQCVHHSVSEARELWGFRCKKIRYSIPKLLVTLIPWLCPPKILRINFCIYEYDSAGIFLNTDPFQHCNCVPYSHFFFFLITCMYDRYKWKIVGLSLLILSGFKYDLYSDLLYHTLWFGISWDHTNFKSVTVSVLPTWVFTVKYFFQASYRKSYSICIRWWPYDSAQADRLTWLVATPNATAVNCSFFLVISITPSSSRR